MIKEGDKLYFIVRNDISRGLAFAQLLHVFRQFIEEHGDTENEWFKSSNYIAVLSVPGLDSLLSMVTLADMEEIKHSYFCEPDLNDEITALVLEPSEKTKKLCRNLRLYT